MKYAIKKNAAAADLNALIASIEALELTIESLTFPMLQICPLFRNATACATDDLLPTLFVESDFNIQAVSAGWTLQTITDKGSVVFKSFSNTNVAQFVKGRVYLVDQYQAFALQMIPAVFQLQVPLNKSAGLSTIFQSTKVVYFAYQDSVPQGLTEVTAIQVNFIPENATQVALDKQKSNFQKIGNMSSVVAKGGK